MEQYSGIGSQTMLSPWLIAALIGGTFLGLLLFELCRPLRRSVEGKLRRDARNFALAALSAVTVQLAEVPITLPIASSVEERGWGVLKSASASLAMPLWLEIVLTIVALDYSFYIW